MDNSRQKRWITWVNCHTIGKNGDCAVCENRGLESIMKKRFRKFTTVIRVAGYTAMFVANVLAATYWILRVLLLLAVL
jgi:hypothetical protein